MAVTSFWLLEKIDADVVIEFTRFVAVVNRQFKTFVLDITTIYRWRIIADDAGCRGVHQQANGLF